MSNTFALGKLQPEPVDHIHGSCAEKVEIMRGLILNGANFQSEVVLLLVGQVSPQHQVKSFLHKNLSPPPLPALRESEATA